MGWGRWFRYTQLKIIRLEESTRSVAIGLAFGASVSFTPLPGLHIISAALLSRLAGGSALASLAGTLVGNPWTFPIMWWMAHRVGDYTFRLFGGKVVEMPKGLDWASFKYELSHHPMELIIPWEAGGIILMALSWPLFYILFYRMVKTLRHKRGHKREPRHA